MNQINKKIKNELFTSLGIFFIIVIFFKWHYSQEPIQNIIKLLGMFFLIFILPGYVLFRHVKIKNIIERVYLLIGFSFSLILIVTYYVSVFSNMNYKKFFIPLWILILVLGLIIQSKLIFIKDSKKNEKADSKSHVIKTKTKEV